ncbi:alpha/beta hydrolase [Rheinheimera nanhaiensis]|uniref:Polyhydroxybutyrate depolymerase n=1 Tax=Rheinheimera nanhaiensis E407-8 TaxID=562729 RepID=I1E039_9GAMM|nr:alpha/beta hydrolase [Rheinheimera nanhaiensis]GAB59667.1 polyhydroxybutyrate depolymerase [Rheinheimera nanhaiensis E407-8]
MKRYINALLVISLMTLTACQSSEDNADTLSNSTATKIELNGRSYLLALPQQYQPGNSYKLLLAFHPSGGSSEFMRSISQFENLSADYIVAYPKSEQIEWNEGCDCNVAHRLGADDLGFTLQVINDVKARHQVTEGEVYAAGYSQGGLFVQNLACNLSASFKAVAVVAAPMSVQLAESCAPQQPVSVMMVHGTADTALPYQGLVHSNFGLIGSPDTIALLAGKNDGLPYALDKSLSSNVSLRSYHNGRQKFQLYSMKNGGHNWKYTDFDTSKEILRFFASAEQPELPEHSRLINTEQGQFHVRAMGQNNPGPAVVLLAGPNYNYHSDSAWFAALQPLLSEQYRVYSIDRLGNAYSSSSDELSYRRFADDLALVLQQLEETHITVVAFASASISARWFYQLHQQQFDINAMLYIDPDIPLPHSVSLYQGYPADWYKVNLDALLPHLAAGNWTQRTRDKLTLEYQEVQQLVSSNDIAIDWSYFEQIMQLRLLIPQQQARAREIAAYSADLDSYATLPMITSIPVSVIDSDFEQQQIAQVDDDAELLAALEQWQQEGSAWSAEQASVSNGQYIALTNSDHLVPLEQPLQIKQALDWLFSQLQLD